MKGASECLGVLPACRDFRIHFMQPHRVCVLTDSRVRKGICQRTGLEKATHLELAHVRLQASTRKARIMV